YGKVFPIALNHAGHLRPVSGLDSDSTFLYSGGYDLVVRKWNISSGSQIAVSSRHNAFITTIRITNEFVLSGSEDGIIKVWNKDSISELRFFDIVQSINAILAYDGRLAIGTSVGVKLVDLISGQEIIYITVWQ
ncbi:hypothetical protein MP638_006098, partial [Amoeboaphelidium occidentale]